MGRSKYYSKECRNSTFCHVHHNSSILQPLMFVDSVLILLAQSGMHVSDPASDNQLFGSDVAHNRCASHLHKPINSHALQGDLAAINSMSGGTLRRVNSPQVVPPPAAH